MCACPVEPRGCHCAACHVCFSGLRNFDRHQLLIDGRTVCRPPQDLGLVVLRTVHDTDQPVWGRPGPESGRTW
jgi:hypothetical protein